MARRSSKLSVLHVDDDPGVRRAVARILGPAGFHVVGEPDGPAGLAAARRARPDLVILDVDLPGLSGFEVCVRLRADVATRRVPILHLSGARIDVRDRVQGLDGGADAYLVQPVAPEELIAVARVLVARGARKPEPRRRTQGSREAAALREDAVQLATQLLRGPLSAIAINVSGLVGGTGDPVARARARAVADAHGAATRIMSDLAELAYLEARGALLPLESRSPRQLVDGAVERLRRAGGGVTPTVEVPSEPAVRCDPERMEGALAALLARATKGSAPDAHLRVEANPEGEEVHLRVEGGAPVTDEEHALLESSFWSPRVRRQDSRVPDLALVRAVIHAHHGRIWLDRDGATFHVTIPTSPLTARSRRTSQVAPRES